MPERHQQIEDIYRQYKASLTPDPASLIERRRLPERVNESVTLVNRPMRGSRNSETTRLYDELSDLIRETPGIYPLKSLSYGPSEIGHMGFSFGFDYLIGDDLFDMVNYWAYNRWGLRVERKAEGEPAEIEVLGAKGQASGEGLTLLHLPEGYTIPCGPMHFEGDFAPELPVTEESVEATENFMTKLAGKMGLNWKEVKSTIPQEFLFERPLNDRFFYWKPVILEGKNKIAIDFTNIVPANLGLNWETAPIIRDTTIPVMDLD